MGAHFPDRTGVVDREADRDLELDAEPEVVDAGALDEAEPGDPLYPVALLKVAMRVRRLDGDGAQHFEAILEDVLRDLTIDREAFGRYLARNRGRLMQAVRRRGY